MTNPSRVNLRSHDHSQFNRGAGKMKEAAWYFCKILFFTTPFPFPSGFKALVLRLFGATVGRRTIIRPRVNIQMPWKLQVGDDCWIGEEVLLLNFDQLVIGSNVCISQRAFLCGGNHDYRDPGMAFREAKISVHDGVWIGAAAFIGPGVVVGTDAVITATTVISESVEAYGIYKGNPAVRIGDRWNETN